MRQNWLLLLGVLVTAAAGITSCAKPPTPKVAVQPPPPPPPPPPPKPQRPKTLPLRAPILASWQFNQTDCSASASSRAVSLDVSISARQLALAVRTGAKAGLKGKGAVPIVFTSGTGNWTLDGTVTAAHRISAMQPMSEDTGSQILVLIEGGMVKFGGPAASLPRLRVPNGGAAGRAWFDCVRQRMAR